jgi:hypothetical protein
MKLQISLAIGMITPARMEGKTLENVSRVTNRKKNNDLHFKIYEKGPFSIHLKVKGLDTTLVEGKQ